MPDRSAVRGRLARLRRRAPAAVLALALLGQVALLAWHARTLWFFGDDWSFLVHRDLGEDPVHALLDPHNEHWSTVPVVLFRLLFAIYGVGSYLPYAMMPIAAHAAACAVLYVLLRRSSVTPWVAVLTVLVIGFIAGGAGAENTLWDFQVGFVGSCLLGLLALLLLRAGGPTASALGVAALLLAVMSSGTGLVMVAWACVDVLLRRGPRAALLVGAVPAIAYVAWYLGFGRGGHGAPPPDPAVAPLAALHGLAEVWSRGLAMPGAGPAVLALLVLAVAVPRLHRDLFALGASGLAAMVVAYALFGYGRSGLPIETLGSSRYVYFGIVCSGPALAAGLQVLAGRLRGRPWALTVGWVAAATAVVALGAAQAATFAADRRATDPGLRERLSAAVELTESGERLLATQPAPTYHGGVDVADLVDGALAPTLPRPRPGDAAVLETRHTLQVGVGTEPFGLPALSVAGTAGVRDLRPGPVTGCLSTTAERGATITLGVPAGGGSVTLTVSGGRVATRLVEGERTTSERRFRVTSERPFELASTAGGRRLRVVVPGGPLTVCPPG